MLTFILPAFVMTILKILLVVLSMIGMIFLYVAIGRLSRIDEQPNSQAAEHLRNDVEQNSDVITEDSVFHNFLARDSKNTNLLASAQEKLKE